MKIKNAPAFPGAMLLFAVIMFFTAYVTFCMDQRTRIYENGTYFSPEDLKTVNTVLNPKKTGEGSLAIELFAEEEAEQTALAVSNSIPVSVWQDGRLLYTMTEYDAYERIQVIPLRRFTGKSSLEIRYDQTKKASLPTRHLLIGNLDYIRKKIADISVYNSFFLGMLLMMFLLSLVLYLAKQSEKYLYYHSVVSFLSFINLSITFGFWKLNVSWQFSARLRSVLLAVCAMMFFLVIRGLYPQKETPHERLLLKSLAVSVALISILVLEGGLNAEVNYYFRLIVIPFVVLRLCHAFRRKKKDAVFLFLAYAVMEGLCLSSYYSNKYTYYGELFGFWRIIELVQVIFLTVVACVINIRFAGQFHRCELLQEELAGLNASLERKVEERTGELKEQQKRRQTTMQNIFHDLRSPIYILQTQIRRIPESPELAGLKKNLRQRTDYMQKLTEELFLVANLESNNVIFAEDEVELDAVLKEISAGIGQRAQEKQVTVECVCQPAAVWGDALHLQQALQNLADNALHYVNPGGTIRIEMSLRDNCVVIEVRNSGSYIAPDEISQVFERYYRSRQKHDPHSSGLGLSIAWEIVKAHDGNIWVESTREDGTGFYVKLPAL